MCDILTVRSNILLTMEIGYYISSKLCTLLLILIYYRSIIGQLPELSKKNRFESNILPILGVALLKLKKHFLEVSNQF